MDRGAWQATVHRVAKSQTWLKQLRGSDGKESACNVGDLGPIPGFGRSPGGGHGNPLQYSCLENLHGQRSLADYISRGHTESNTTEQLNTYSSSKKQEGTSQVVLVVKKKEKKKNPAWQCRRHETQVPWVQKFPWRRACQPTPVFLPGQSEGQRNLWGSSPWCHKEVMQLNQLRMHTSKTHKERKLTHRDIKTESYQET